MEKDGYKWIPPGKRADGCQERIDTVTCMAQTVNLKTGKIENYKLVCPKCGKIIERDDQSRSCVHRCMIKGEMHLSDIHTLDMVVPPGMTIDEFYSCVRYGLQHREDAVKIAQPKAPPSNQVEGQITMEEYFGNLIRKEG